MGTIDLTDTAPATGAANHATPEERPSADPAPSEIHPGDCFGRYTIRSLIGAGGMGRVFAAIDAELGRTVALKLLRSDRQAASPQMRARLLREAQALARLHHPNVVTVHDVGTQGDQVFIAMDLVEGPTLTAWLGGGKRRWREVLAVFLAAGRGLAAAHAAGITHRDFKPSNVIVGKERVVVIDFGLARAGGTEPSEAAEPSADRLLDVNLTMTGDRMGTPPYMAPEQLRGDATDARSDQFSFCVGLWEALHGERPPSARRADVPGRVNAVIARGLAEDPAARWPSMDALLAALARDPAAARRRIGFGAALVALGVVAAWGLVRARAGDPCAGSDALIAPLWDEPARARVAEAFRRTGLPYAEDTSRKVDASLAGRLDRWARAHREICQASHVRHEQSDTMLDLRMQCLGRARQEIGALVAELGIADADALPRATVAASQVGDIESCSAVTALSAVAPLPRDPAALLAVDELRVEAARLTALSLLGKWKESGIAGRALIARARVVGYAPLLARALRETGAYESSAGDIDAGIEMLYEAVRTGFQAHDDALVTRALSDLMFALGVRKQQFEAAEVTYRMALAALERTDRSVRLLRGVFNYRAAVLERKGEHWSSLPLRLIVVNLSEIDGGPQSYQVGTALGHLAGTLRRLGRPRDARPLFDRAIAITEKAVGAEHPWFTAMLGNAGLNLYACSEYDEAGALFERILAVDEKTFGPDHRVVGVDAFNLADVRYQQRRVSEARALALRAIRIREARLGGEHPDVAWGQVLLGAIDQLEGKPDEAHRLYQQALAIQHKAFGAEHEKLAETYQHDAGALLELGRLIEARAAAERAIAIDRNTIGEDHPHHGDRLMVMARILGAERRFRDAEPLYRRSLVLIESEQGAETPELVAPLAGLGETLIEIGDIPAALAMAGRAVRLATKAPADVRAGAQFTLARAQWATGDRAEAVALARAARAKLVALPFPSEHVPRIDRWLARNR